MDSAGIDVDYCSIAVDNHDFDVEADNYIDLTVDTAFVVAFVQAIVTAIVVAVQAIVTLLVLVQIWLMGNVKV